ncbi:MAG: DUF3307 domain-containing protein [Kiritimatiellae bacterium]|nr:DUF3307 domain-containing protein [Kiritimatiellia bacterium]
MTLQLTIILMLLGHLVADYTLQGCLADLKCKSWWEKTAKAELGKELSCTKYKHDYIAGLLCHSLYWSILVCLPFYSHPVLWIAILVNTVIHAVVDDLKANRLSINLITDQIIHLLQIAGTALCLA